MKQCHRGSPHFSSMPGLPTKQQQQPSIAIRPERRKSPCSDHFLSVGKMFMRCAGRIPVQVRRAGVPLSAAVGPIRRNPAGNTCPFPTRSSDLTSAAKSTPAFIRSSRETPAGFWPATSMETGWALDALGYLDAARAMGIPVALERSRSGDGAHVWAFFSGPVPASVARQVGAHLLREAMTIRAELDLASYDRLFPAQDFMPKGSFGNLIALPLNGECRKRGTTVFLDPSNA